MTSNYKKLGQYIQPINIRNKDLEELPLMGLSINKVFIPSIANTIGTNMASYKIIKRNQFAYGPVTSRNGDKITIALFEDYDKALISQAYIPFEVIDENILNPEYLMMWFRRAEFDRYARFKSHGSARETFDWEEMCEVELPVPSIKKQLEIVKEYNTVVNRIKLNEQLNQKLEETAQALYKYWFVDFEFPNAEGKTYKSSGGEMVYNEELDMEIPEGWSTKKIKDIGNVVTGKTPSTSRTDYFDGDIPFLTIPDMHKKLFVVNTSRSLTKIGANSQSNKTLPPKTICVSCIGTGGLVVLTDNSVQTNQQINSVIPYKIQYTNFYFFNLKQKGKEIIEYGNKGSVGVNMNKSEFEELIMIEPKNEIKLEFSQKIEACLNASNLNQKELLRLENLKDLLLSKMTKVEVEKELTN
ncbi:restriction endonuclease subunit S [Gaetbulibacter jejuensis]|uniref:restriction endonuclease subunit S n=1 Tax=Gaetbulibacter jejuensis TaxID=584607 RepID=UPI00300A1964